MKHKIADLEGSSLDAAVAKAEGYEAGLTKRGTVPTWCQADGSGGWMLQSDFRPSIDWRVGGPIIEREEIVLMPGPQPDAAGRVYWRAVVMGSLFRQEGPTHLIAAMRARVAANFGDEVELP